MKHLKAVMILPALALGLTACNDDNPWTGSREEGGIVLSLQTDSSVLTATRANDAESAVIPDASDFSIALTKSDGSFAQTWTRLADFNREESFKIGDYTLRAFYGAADREGFDAPYFEGSTSFTVHPSTVEEVSVTATLANAMVSIRYTDEFNAAFPLHSAAVRSEGNDYIMFSQNETRPAYVIPSEIDLAVTITNGAGKQVTIQPAGFKALPQYHYVVTIGVKSGGSKGDLVLDINFEENVEAEVVEVELGDQLFNASAPVVEAYGMPADGAEEIFENTQPNANPRFHAIAFGGLKEANLSISSTSYTPAFGKEVQLVNAPADIQKAIQDSGLEAGGFFRNVDKMAVLNLSKFAANLPVGTHTVTLRIKDALTRESEAAKYTITVTPVEITIEAVGDAAYYSEQIEVSLTTNCPAVKDNVIFKVPDDNGKPVEATILNIAENVTRGAQYSYVYTLGVPRILRAAFDVNAFYGNTQIAASTTRINVEIPKYTLDVDAFSSKVLFRVKAEKPSLQEVVVNSLTIYQNGNALKESQLQRDVENGIITVLNLDSDTEYPAFQTCIGADDSSKIAVPSFHTEAEVMVPNGSFDATGRQILFNGIALGGKYKVSPVSYQLKCNINVFEPAGWVTLNDLTCYANSANQNSWFMVPSTFIQGNAAIVRSVGYNHNGTSPATSGGAFNTKYYCENAPAYDALDKASGELFLGSYSFDGNANRSEGIAFASRPASLKFDYKYAPIAGEHAVAEVKVLDASNNVIASGERTLDASGDFSTVTIDLNGYPFGQKAAKFYVSFRSTKESNVTVNVPSGTALNQGASLGNGNQGDNSAKAVAIGSVLTVDNVGVDYNKSAAPVRSRVRSRK